MSYLSYEGFINYHLGDSKKRKYRLVNKGSKTTLEQQISDGSFFLSSFFRRKLAGVKIQGGSSYGRRERNAFLKTLY